MNNPLAGTDPTGYSPKCDVGGEAFCGPFGYGDNCSYCVSTSGGARRQESYENNSADSSSKFIFNCAVL
jgi:hypothetical protein